MNRIKGNYLAFLAVLLSPMAANADPIPGYAVSNDAEGVSQCDGVQYICGFEFQVTDGLRVSALGFFDMGQDGWATGPASVGIWDLDSQVQLGSASINSTDTLIGRFRYQNISTLLLSPGTAYVIGGGGAEGSFPQANSQSVLLTFDPRVVSSNNVRYCRRPPCFPNSVNAGRGDWTVANFLFEDTSADVPEPGTMALFGIGFAGMGLARRRRKA